MTEAEWLTASDSLQMIRTFEPLASMRKMRLLAVASARTFWSRIPIGTLRAAIEVAELCVDEPAELPKLGQNRLKVYRLSRGIGSEEEKDWYYDDDNRIAYSAIDAAMFSHGHKPNYDLGGPWSDLLFGMREALCPLMREILNPFCQEVDSHWCTSTVLSLATGIYDEKAFDRLPILADALQDAGCDSEDILNHCRQPGEHVRGCWALDVVLRKE
jgi:hypothetical protein